MSNTCCLLRKWKRKCYECDDIITGYRLVEDNQVVVFKWGRMRFSMYVWLENVKKKAVKLDQPLIWTNISRYLVI